MISSNGSSLNSRTIPVLFVKRWCDRELTAVAWSRVLIRILPIVHEYDHSFSEMQNPTLLTKCNRSVYLTVMATVQEVYGNTALNNYKSYINSIKEKRKLAVRAN